MIKLGANLSKKVPLPGVEFSSQQFGAAMEVEVSEAAGADEIASKLRQVYAVLERSVDGQIRSASGAEAQRRPEAPRGFFSPSGGAPADVGLPPFGGGAGRAGNGNGHSRGNGRATQSQIKAVFAIGRDRGVNREGIVQILQGEFGVQRPDDLTVQQASELIGMLQGMERIRR